MGLETLADDVADWLRELGPAGPLVLFVLFAAVKTRCRGTD
jgi:hypothetical protein